MAAPTSRRNRVTDARVRPVLDGVADAYHNRRDDVEEAAPRSTEALNRELLGIGGDDSALTRGPARRSGLRNIEQGLRRHTRRLRPCAEIPAADESGISAARLRAHRRSRSAGAW